MMIVDRVNRGIESLADEFGEALVTVLKRGLVDEGKYATGSLVDTVSYGVKVNSEGKAVIQISAADYLRYVDKGRKPGKFPNITAISNWVSAKGISQDAVFPIARKIAEQGIPATNVLRDSIKEVEQIFRPKFEKQMQNLVGVVLTNDVFSATNTQGKIISKNLR